MNLEVLDNTIRAIEESIIRKVERKNRVNSRTVNALANLVSARAAITKELTRKKTAERKNTNKPAVCESSKYI